MKRILKCCSAALLAALCAFALSGCIGFNLFSFLFPRACSGCSPSSYPSSLNELRGMQYVSFSDKENTISFRITDGRYFGGFGTVAADSADGEETVAYFEIDGYDGEIYVYEANAGRDSLMFRLSCEYVNKKDEKGIKINSVHRGSHTGKSYKGVFLEMSDITDKSVIKPYEYFADFRDADGYIIFQNDNPVNLNRYEYGYTTKLCGTVTVVTAERDRRVSVKVCFNGDYTFEIYEVKIHSTETVSAESEGSIASGTYSCKGEFSYTLHFTEDGLFTEELSRAQFSTYPDIVITRIKKQTVQ